MADNKFDIIPDDWRIVKENLIQLHCENVSWEQASDKIPLDLVRCLFTIDWTQIPDSYAIWCYIVGLGLNCKFIDLLFKRSVINFIEISSLFGFIVSEIIYSQTDTLTEELMDLR